MLGRLNPIHDRHVDVHENERKLTNGHGLTRLAKRQGDAAPKPTAAGFGNVKINAALLKLGVFGKMSCVSEDDQMDRMMQAKVLRLDHKNINRIDGLELVDKVERIYLQGNRIRVIENFDFLSKLC